MITARDVAVLLALVRYYVLNRAQIQRLCFPDDGNGRVTRRRIQALVAERYVHRTQMQVVDFVGTAAPAYHPSPKGVEFAAEHCEDERLLLTPTQAPNPHHLLHWLAISEFHIALDAALPLHEDIGVVDWLNEWDVVNKDETVPEKRYRLYTLVQDRPRLVCAPDAAFLLRVGSHAKVHYLELDRNTTGVRQIAASKTPGYAGMAERQLASRHFPEATVPGFTVLSVSPTEKRRDALSRAIAEKPGAELWRFAASSDLHHERLLTEPVWHRCDGQVTSLVRRGGGA